MMSFESFTFPIIIVLAMHLKYAMQVAANNIYAAPHYFCFDYECSPYNSS